MMRTHSKSIGNLFPLIALLASLAGGAVTYTPARAIGTLFVKPGTSPNDSCQSWATACPLQVALSRAIPGDEIWVRAGTYTPHSSDRTVSFTLVNEVAIYGGFNGTETQPEQRDPAANVTILSGDLNGDDGLDPANNSENSFHVVRSTNTNHTAILDGFTIQGGNANSDFPPDFNGGGMLNSNSSPTLMRVIFSENRAEQGGGMLNQDASSPTLTNVTFIGNRAFSTGIGGGMASWENSNPRLTNVTFSGNSASFHGGGMANTGNTPILSKVTFSGNSADGGGGIFNSGSSAKLTNVTFSGNSASVEGGGLVNDGGSPTLINVTFSGNSAVQRGGGMFNRQTSLPTLINTIVANSLSGGDCVNSQSALHPSSANNLIENASTACGLTNGNNGNITGVDPKLGPLANNGGRTRTHALRTGSPAIDAGADANCPTTDQRGVTRPRGSHCDIGAFELRIFRIRGNASLPGVKLKYEDGVPRTVTSGADGRYTIRVPENWSGTVTPSLLCYKFSPLKRIYDPVRADKTAQNYAPSFDATSPCAKVAIRIKATTRTLVIPKNSGELSTFAGLNQGPVRMNGIGRNFIASARISIPGQPFISELMGLPANLLDRRYAFPFYDSLSFDSHLRLVNVSSVQTTVTVRILNQLIFGCMPRNGPYTLDPGESILVSCGDSQHWIAGPVVVESSRGEILASLRVQPSGGASVSEVIGIPATQLAPRYAFPWYDNTQFNSQLRVANVGGRNTEIHLFIAGVEKRNCKSDPPLTYPYLLGPQTSVRVRCPGVPNGPLIVRGSTSAPLVAALRILPNDDSLSSFAEVMGLPASQWSNQHAFPWYDSKGQNTQLRIANIGTRPTQIRLFIGGVQRTNCTSIPSKPYPFNLPANRSLLVTCPNVNKGPLKILGSSASPLVTSLRLLPKNAPAGTMFSEFMGLPLNKLATAYVLPWYDNVNFRSQLRIAVP